ncbi:MAG: M20/M25/M40 family metallo-hydrolase [Candidatus Choladocola sp.]|nr:M20/M25/M40 family metallo-hydrolase [Candidatus Choladocola sp.]
MTNPKGDILIHRERLYRNFAELTAVDSVSFQEREMADRLKTYLTKLGFEVEEDQAGDHYGGNAGNVYGRLKGSLPGPGVLLSAHMDTVSPGLGKKAVFSRDGTVTSAGNTVLGADDVAGIVEILEGIESVLEAGIPHRDVEVLFPIAEEVYIKGTEVFDFSRIRAKKAYVFDLSGPVGSASLREPTLISFSGEITGRAAHAGFSPENGINAIRILCGIVSEITQGRIDPETTVNIGTISGGEATNIVSERCCCRGEIRSFNHEKALEVLEKIRDRFRKAAEAEGAGYRLESSTDLRAYQVEPDTPVVQDFKEACERLGIPWKLTSTFGGSDNNNFLRRGISGIVLSCGMYECHSVGEYTKLQDLENGARLVAELIR